MTAAFNWSPGGCCCILPYLDVYMSIKDGLFYPQDVSHPQQTWPPTNGRFARANGAAMQQEVYANTQSEDWSIVTTRPVHSTDGSVSPATTDQELVWSAESRDDGEYYALYNMIAKTQTCSARYDGPRFALSTSPLLRLFNPQDSTERGAVSESTAARVLATRMPGTPGDPLANLLMLTAFSVSNSGTITSTAYALKVDQNSGFTFGDFVYGLYFHSRPLISGGRPRDVFDHWLRALAPRSWPRCAGIKLEQDRLFQSQPAATVEFYIGDWSLADITPGAVNSARTNITNRASVKSVTYSYTNNSGAVAVHDSGSDWTAFDYALGNWVGVIAYKALSGTMTNASGAGLQVTPHVELWANGAQIQSIVLPTFPYNIANTGVPDTGPFFGDVHACHPTSAGNDYTVVVVKKYTQYPTAGNPSGTLVNPARPWVLRIYKGTQLQWESPHAANWKCFHSSDQWIVARAQQPAGIFAGISLPSMPGVQLEDDPPPLGDENLKIAEYWLIKHDGSEAVPCRIAMDNVAPHEFARNTRLLSHPLPSENFKGEWVPNVPL